MFVLEYGLREVVPRSWQLLQCHLRILCPQKRGSSMVFLELVVAIYEALLLFILPIHKNFPFYAWD